MCHLNVYDNLLMGRDLHTCAKTSLILKSYSTHHARQNMHWGFGIFFVKFSFLVRYYFVSDGHKLYSISVCTQMAISQQITLLHWPANVPHPGYDTIRKQIMYGFSLISCSMRDRPILLQQRILGDMRKLS
jgi:hypothetical protein